jgi:hypothetical protein
MTLSKRAILMLVITVLAVQSQKSRAGGAPSTLPLMDTFNYVIGTQTFSPLYHFTSDTPLVETAKAIRAMGSNVVKFRMKRDYFVPPRNDVPAATPSVQSLTDLARDEPSFRALFDMPFAYYLVWTNPFHAGSWKQGLSAKDRAAEYREMYDFARYLLRTYDGSGKTFYLGHWEGDWLLRGEGQTNADIPPAAIPGMIDWLNNRQQAIDDAKRDTPYANVQIYHYTEVNLVQIGIDGRPCLTTDVLPHTHVDYVSYSSYDTKDDPRRLTAALNFIEAHLPPKPGISGKRVFIGEYGFPAAKFSPQQQDARSRQVMRVALQWGCPFVLYWEMYNNELLKDGRQKGSWLIDDRGAKQPVYETHARYYERAKAFVAEFSADHHRPPTFDEFRARAAEFLDEK